MLLSLYALFDILNNRNPFDKSFKQPLKMENQSYLDDIFEQYLRSLTSISKWFSHFVPSKKKFCIRFCQVCTNFDYKTKKKILMLEIPVTL